MPDPASGGHVLGLLSTSWPDQVSAVDRTGFDATT